MNPHLRTLGLSSLPLFALLLSGCNPQPPHSVDAAGVAAAPAHAANQSAWILQGGEDERFERVARHLRGLDLAMTEIGYRYNEVYWARADQNWPYAAYQLGKIETSLANALERRPKRAASAKMFEGPLKVALEAAKAGDAAKLDEALIGLTASCNACHAAEQLAYMHVMPPRIRVSPIFAPPDAGAPVGDAQAQ